MAKLFSTKPLNMLMQEAQETGEHCLKRTLGPVNLIMLGIGAIIGAGLFVRTAAAIADRSGPSVTLAFIVAGIGCAFAWSVGSLRLWLAAALLLHLVVLGWMWYVISRVAPDFGFGATGVFLYWAITGTLVTALVATAITFGPPLLLATCV